MEGEGKWFSLEAATPPDDKVGVSPYEEESGGCDREGRKYWPISGCKLESDGEESRSERCRLIFLSDSGSGGGGVCNCVCGGGGREAC